jgi:hypothetical protein
LRRRRRVAGRTRKRNDFSNNIFYLIFYFITISTKMNHRPSTMTTLFSVAQAMKYTTSAEWPLNYILYSRNASYFVSMVLKKPWFYKTMVFQGHRMKLP